MSSEAQVPNILWKEIERLRERIHSLSTDIQGLHLLSKDNSQRIIDTQKQLVGAIKELQQLERQVEQILRADAIADGIAERLQERRDTGWRIWGVRTAIVSAIIAGIGTVTDLIFRITS